MLYKQVKKTFCNHDINFSMLVRRKLDVFFLSLVFQMM